MSSADAPTQEEELHAQALEVGRLREQGKTWAEVADELGVAESTARDRLKRAQRRGLVAGDPTPTYYALDVLAGGVLLTKKPAWLTGYAAPIPVLTPATGAIAKIITHGADPLTAVPVPVYPNPDGTGTPLAQPLTPDEDGRLPGYVLQPAALDMYVTGSDISPRLIKLGFDTFLSPVASVNGQTGPVVLAATDVGAYSTGAADGRFIAPSSSDPAGRTQVMGTPTVKAPQLRQFVFVEDFGAAGDAKRVSDGQITSGQNTLHSAAAAFTNADIGKAVQVAGAGPGSGGEPNLQGWISAVAGGVATLVTAPGGGVAANAAATVAGAIVTYGSHDADHVTAAGTAVAAAGGGTVGFMPFKSYLISRTVPSSNVVYSGAPGQMTTIYNLSFSSDGTKTNQSAFVLNPLAAPPIGAAGVVNVTFERLRFPGTSTEHTNGISIQMTNMVGLKILRCEFTNNAATGIYIKDVFRTRVIDNYLDNCCTGTGLNPIDYNCNVSGASTPVSDLVVDGNTVTNTPTEAIAITTSGASTLSTAPIFGRIVNNHVLTTPAGAAGIWIETGGVGVIATSQQQLVIANNTCQAGNPGGAPGAGGTSILVTNDSAPQSTNPFINSFIVIASNTCSSQNGINIIGSYIAVIGNVISGCTSFGISATAPGGTTMITANATNGSPTLTTVAGAAGIGRGWQVLTGNGFQNGAYVNDGIGTATWTMSQNFTGSTGAVSLPINTPAVGVRISANEIRMTQNFTSAAIKIGGLIRSSVTNNGVHCIVGATSGFDGISISNCGWVKVKLNDVSFAPRHGIFVQNSNDVKIQSNDIYCSSENGDNTGSGIQLSSNVTGTANTIAGNDIIDDRPAHWQTNAITAGAGCVNLIVRENTMLGMHSTNNPLNSTAQSACIVLRGNKSDVGNWLASASIPLTMTTTINGAGQTLPTGTVNVASTAGANASGSFTVPGVTGTVTYTGVTGSAFTGCTGGSGTPANGAVVTATAASPQTYTNNDPYPQQVISRLGTGVSLSVNRPGGGANQVGITAGVTPILMPGDQLIVTYTTVPTLTKWPLW